MYTGYHVTGELWVVDLPRVWQRCVPFDGRSEECWETWQRRCCAAEIYRKLFVTKEILEKRLHIVAAFPATFCLCFLSLSCNRHCFLITHRIKSRCTSHSVSQKSEFISCSVLAVPTAVHSFCPSCWRNIWCFHTHCVIARNQIRLSTAHSLHFS